MGSDMEAGPWVVYGVAVDWDDDGEWAVEFSSVEEIGWLEFHDLSEAQAYAAKLDKGYPGLGGRVRIVQRNVSRWTFADRGEVR